MSQYRKQKVKKNSQQERIELRIFSQRGLDSKQRITGN